MPVLRPAIYFILICLNNYIKILVFKLPCRDLNLGLPKYQADVLPIELSRLGKNIFYFQFVWKFLFFSFRFFIYVIPGNKRDGKSRASPEQKNWNAKLKIKNFMKFYSFGFSNFDSQWRHFWSLFLSSSFSPFCSVPR